MKFIKPIIALLALGALSLRATAQTTPLTPGGKLPGLVLTHLYNTPLKQLDLAAQQGKVIIIDFWDTRCPGCIILLGRLDSLQQKYGDKVCILPVNYQSRAVIAKFWKNNWITKRLKILTITDDTVFSKLFPHQAVPAEYWIGQDGKFISATNPEYVNDRELGSLIRGNKPTWVSAVQKGTHDFSKPLPLQTGIKRSGRFYSGFLHFLPGDKTDFRCIIDSVGKTIKITCINYNVLGLYGVTLANIAGLDLAKRTEFVVSDKSRLRYYKTTGYRSEWELENTYCYELYWPLGDSLSTAGAYQKMRSDLDSFLGYKSSIRQETADYYVLERTGAAAAAEFGKTNPRQLSLSLLVDLLNIEKALPVVINHLKETDQVYFDYDANQPADIKVINALIRPKGYELKKKHGELPFFYLNDR